MEVKFVAFQLLLWAQEAETFQLRTHLLKNNEFFLNKTKNVRDKENDDCVCTKQTKISIESDICF
jgi:hypothetical protein